MTIPIIYTKEMWLKLRSTGTVIFTDEELNSGKQPFKTIGNAELYVEYKQPEWLKHSKLLRVGAVIPFRKVKA
jgi:hypothetical protein